MTGTTAVSTWAVPALRVEGLHKAFGKLEVLGGIDLAVASHEVVCLIGSSGSGKSTLLRCINLLEPIDAGRIFIGDREITDPHVDVDRVRRRALGGQRASRAPVVELAVENGGRGRILSDGR